MEDIIEFILEFLLEVGNEVAGNKKISKIIRYPIIFLLATFLILVIGGLLFIGIKIINDEFFVGVFFIIVSLILLIGCIWKFRKVYKEKISSMNEE